MLSQMCHLDEHQSIAAMYYLQRKFHFQTLDLRLNSILKRCCIYILFVLLEPCKHSLCNRLEYRVVQIESVHLERELVQPVIVILKVAMLSQIKYEKFALY